MLGGCYGVIVVAMWFLKHYSGCKGCSWGFARVSM